MFVLPVKPYVCVMGIRLDRLYDRTAFLVGSYVYMDHITLWNVLILLAFLWNTFFTKRSGETFQFPAGFIFHHLVQIALHK